MPNLVSLAFSIADIIEQADGQADEQADEHIGSASDTEQEYIYFVEAATLSSYCYTHFHKLGIPRLHN